MKIKKSLIFFLLAHLSFKCLDYNNELSFFYEVFVFTDKLLLINIVYSIFFNYYILSNISFLIEDMMNLKEYILLREKNSWKYIINVIYKNIFLILISFAGVETILIAAFHFDLLNQYFFINMLMIVLNFLFWMLLYLKIRVENFNRNYSFFLILIGMIFVQYIRFYFKIESIFYVGLMLFEFIGSVIIILTINKNSFIERRNI